MKRFEDFLLECKVADSLAGVFLSLADAVKEIAQVVDVADGEKASSTNSSGEDQLQLDLQADRIIQKKLAQNSAVGLIASEEIEEQKSLGEGEYAVCYDPLDGSSLVDVNLAVGSIFGIYRAGDFLGLTGRDQLGALIAVYGPRTTIMLTLLDGVYEFVLNGKGDFVLSRENLRLSEGKMFAPGNLRATVSEGWYLDLVNFWIKEQYTLRYSGGMVPDINQILVKGKGIFSYPGYSEANEGKLRLLFECAPMALLIEQAGGKASDGKMAILDKTVNSVHQRTPVFLGSVGEVERCEKYLKADY